MDSSEVDPNIKQITIEFSEPLNGHNTGVDLGPLGMEHFPKVSRTDRVWSADRKSWTINVDLEPNKHYQILIDNNFRTEDRIPLKPLLIDFKTK